MLLEKRPSYCEPRGDWAAVLARRDVWPVISPEYGDLIGQNRLSMILQENAWKLSCIPFAIESTNTLRFLWTLLSLKSAPFYRTAGFLGIPGKCSAFYRKHKFLESTEHIIYIDSIQGAFHLLLDIVLWMWRLTAGSPKVEHFFAHVPPRCHGAQLGGVLRCGEFSHLIIMHDTAPWDYSG